MNANNEHIMPSDEVKQVHVKRTSAFLVHFSISLFIFIVLTALIVFFWYPFPLLKADGGWQGIKIIAGVDVVLGPLLTLIVFNPKKSIRMLQFDIGLIIAGQILALIYGVYVVYTERPVVVALEDGIMHTVTYDHFAAQNITKPELLAFGERFPVYTYVAKPATAEELSKMHLKLFDEKIPPHAQFDLYQPLSQHLDKLKKVSVNMTNVLSNQAVMKENLTAFLQEHEHKMTDYAYIPLKARYETLLLVIDPKTGRAVKTLHYRPTQPSKNND